MTRSYSSSMVALCLAIVGLRSACAQTAPATLTRLASPVDSSRVHAFYELDRIARTAIGARATQGPRTAVLAERAKGDRQLATALTTLLHRENELLRTGVRSASMNPDDLMEYRIDLAVTVARMRDPTSVNDLMPWVGGGGAVRDALISFGEAAVPGLIAELTNSEWEQRTTAASTLAVIAGSAPHPLSPPAKASVRAAFLRVLENESDTFVRVHAIDGLATFSDDEVRSTMERLATSDPATDPSRTDAVHYPVREAAKAWLAKHPR